MQEINHSSVEQFAVYTKMYQNLFVTQQNIVIVILQNSLIDNRLGQWNFLSTIVRIHGHSTILVDYRCVYTVYTMNSKGEWRADPVALVPVPAVWYGALLGRNQNSRGAPQCSSLTCVLGGPGVRGPRYSNVIEETSVLFQIENVSLAIEQ